MFHARERLNWLIRKCFILVNRFLVSIFGVKKTKTLLTKYYQQRTIDLESPKKLNEKLLCSYYDSDMDQLARLTDKYAVREHIVANGLESVLVPIYGVYTSFDQIDFDNLPERFVLKATHGCDMNYICLDKSKLDLKALRKRVDFWLRCNIAYISLELHYARIQPRILCEQYLETQGEIVDYKFHCHNGDVLFILVCTERTGSNYRNVYMPDWTHRPEVITHARINPNGAKKPERFEQMLDIARRLSDGFPFVRVDLYEVNGKVYFGELTFTPATGTLTHFKDSFLLELGERWN